MQTPSKVVSYQVMQDSASINCSPSYSFLYGASMNTVFAQLEMYVIDVALMKGWYVVIPDYEGPKASFTAGKRIRTIHLGFHKSRFKNH